MCQLEDAHKALAAAQERAEEQATNLQRQTTEFQKHQASLEQRLKEITYSSTSDDALEVFQSRMVKVQRLEIATNYLQLVKEVETLRNDATRLLRNDPRTALSCYCRLRNLAQLLQGAQLEAEGAAPLLISLVEEETASVYGTIRSGLLKDFQSTLEKMKWPTKEMNLLGGVLETWSEQVEYLLDLQEPDLLHMHSSSADGAAASILPLEIMVQPLAQRFRYHFYGDRPTNRLDKPEYFLSHILDLLDRHGQFMIDNLQPIIDRRTQRDPALEEIYPDALSAFITTLLPLAVTKSLSLLQQIASQPQLLSHFIQESITFDNALQESWNYNPLPGTYTEWRGLTATVLEEHGFFDQWLKVEKDFALSRYSQIRNAADNNELDYEGVASGQSVPTKATIRVNDLLETITDRYRDLPMFRQKLEFLTSIQLEIFDKYYAYLHEALQAYLAMSHTAGRLLQGQLNKNEAFDQRALSSLCKIYGSAEYLERKMSDWSDDIFFVDLWDELQQRVRDKGTGKDLPIDEIAAKTSQTIKQDSIEIDDGSGSLFDEIATSYRNLRESSTREILRLLDINIQEAVKPYGRLDAWASLAELPRDASTLNPSSALDSILQVTSVLLGYMSRVLGRAAQRKMVKHFCTALQTSIINSVILAHNFSAAGAAQLKRDIIAIEQAIDTDSRIGNVANASLQKLKQAAALLSLPIKRSSNRVAADDTDDTDGAWGFDDEPDESNAEPLDKVASKDEWGLWEAEKAIFKSNAAARQALGDMGLDYLSEHEARNILKKRVELGS